MGRITVPGQPRQDPISVAKKKKAEHGGVSLSSQHKEEDCDPGWPERKQRPYLQNNQSKKGRRHSSNSRVPAMQA
jgi:hypothetical protein